MVSDSISPVVCIHLLSLYSGTIAHCPRLRTASVTAGNLVLGFCITAGGELLQFGQASLCTGTDFQQLFFS
ncbi:hypothetical protein D3C79_876300 [compost metagenome]